MAIGKEKQKTKLYICATPIGNLGDVSQRLREVLTLSDVIFAEDTRVTGKLLNYLDVKCEIKRLDENTMQNRMSDVFDCINAGKVCAYCTDAGMPGVSDPGLSLIEEAYNRNVAIEVIPGPSAVINAYVSSGFNNPNFYFGGFLPRKKSEIEKTLNKLNSLDAVLIFYESPKRLTSTLQSISSIWPGKQISVCRELTKLHEEIYIGIASDVYNEFNSRDKIKGECVICIDNKLCDKSNNENELFELNNVKLPYRQLTTKLIESGLKSKDVARIVSETFGISKKDAYNIAIEINNVN